MMRLGLFASLLMLPCCRAAAAAPVDQWIAVVAPAFREAIAPLVAHRRSQGYKVVVLAPEKPADLRQRLAALCRQHPGRSHILLVGAVRSLHPQRQLEPCEGTISRMLAQATDAPYGCLDGSRLPKVAVGRFPAREVAECQAMVSKTLALEKAGPGAWKQQLRVLAGIPAFNPAVDRLVESMAFARFELLAPTWSGRALYTAASSRFFL
ncbi:MAG: C25 family cysteine peptidase, partial [Gemmataceae bacterium]